MPANTVPSHLDRLVSSPMPASPGVKPTFMVTWAVEENFGGMTAMCLKRTGLFHDHGAPSAVVTFNADPTLASIRLALEEKGKLHPAVPLLNLHEYYASRFLPAGPTGPRLEPPDVPATWMESAQVTKTTGGTLFYINYRSPEDESHTYREYFRPDGSRYLTDTTRPGARGSKVSSRTLCLLAADGAVHAKFTSAGQLYRHWLTELVDQTDADVIVDSKFSAGFLLTWNHPRALKCYNFHSTHVVAGGDLKNGKISPAHRKIIDSRDSWDVITFLTQSQRTAFMDRFGDSADTAVISNPVDGPKDLPPFGERDPGSVMHVGRFTKGKNIGAVIDIIDAVAASHIPVHLELIGDGDQRSILEGHVRDLGIGHLVTFHGHVNDVAQRLSKARALLLCSSFEGQPLAILEAQAQGCVPVAYDVDFGPRDVITDQQSGFLVSFGDQQTAVNAIMRLLTDDELAARMSAQAFDSAKNYSGHQVFAHWKETLDMARLNRKDRQALAGANARLAALRFQADGGLDLEVAVDSGTLGLDGLSLLISERAGDSRALQQFEPYGEMDGIFSFRIPANLRTLLPGADALDANLLLEANGLKRTVRLSATPNLQSVPYFTAYGNLSFK